MEKKLSAPQKKAQDRPLGNYRLRRLKNNKIRVLLTMPHGSFCGHLRPPAWSCPSPDRPWNFRTRVKCTCTFILTTSRLSRLHYPFHIVYCCLATHMWFSINGARKLLKKQNNDWMFWSRFPLSVSGNSKECWSSLQFPCMGVNKLLSIL
jgi:hypothetical protein